MIRELVRYCWDLVEFTAKEILYKDYRLKLSVSNPNFVYFECEQDPKINFRIHSLEFRDVRDMTNWFTLGYHEEVINFKGIRMGRNISGFLKGRGRNIELTARSGGGITELKTSDELLEERSMIFAPIELMLLKQVEMDERIKPSG